MKKPHEQPARDEPHQSGGMRAETCCPDDGHVAAAAATGPLRLEAGAGGPRLRAHGWFRRYEPRCRSHGAAPSSPRSRVSSARPTRSPRRTGRNSRAAGGRAQRDRHSARRCGLWADRHLRRADPDAGAGRARRRGAEVHPLPHHGDLRPVARGAADRAQSSHRGNGFLTEWATGFPSYSRMIPKSTATIGEILKGNGYATWWFGKNHNTPDWETTVAGPFDRWPTGHGLRLFLRLQSPARRTSITRSSSRTRRRLNRTRRPKRAITS